MLLEMKRKLDSIESSSIGNKRKKPIKDKSDEVNIIVEPAIEPGVDNKLTKEKLLKQKKQKKEKKLSKKQLMKQDLDKLAEEVYGEEILEESTPRCQIFVFYQETIGNRR